jgi:hypothetical protein
LQAEANVHVIVGKTFDEEILNSKKDVVLEVCEVSIPSITLCSYFNKFI